MAAVDLLLGGWLTTDDSWRWAFGIKSKAPSAQRRLDVVGAGAGEKLRAASGDASAHESTDQ
jgi:hypothetical protein